MREFFDWASSPHADEPTEWDFSWIFHLSHGPFCSRWLNSFALFWKTGQFPNSCATISFLQVHLVQFLTEFSLMSAAKALSHWLNWILAPLLPPEIILCFISLTPYPQRARFYPRSQPFTPRYTYWNPLMGIFHIFRRYPRIRPPGSGIHWHGSGAYLTFSLFPFFTRIVAFFPSLLDFLNKIFQSCDENFNHIFFYSGEWWEAFKSYQLKSATPSFLFNQVIHSNFICFIL